MLFIIIIFLLIISIILLFNMIIIKGECIYERYINNNKNVYVLRGYLCDEQFYKLWNQIITDFPLERCYIIYDNSKNSINEDFYKKYKENIILHTNDYCKKINKYHDSMWYTAETTVCICYNELKKRLNFEYLWMIENDVYIDGSILKSYENADDMNEDFLATHIEQFNDNKEWVHWGRLIGEIKNIDYDKQVKCFFPLIRCSIKMLELLNDNLGKSSGYCEVYFPTLANINGLTYKNLPSNMIGKFEAYEIVRLSTLPKNNDNKLYHKFIYENFR